MDPKVEEWWTSVLGSPRHVVAPMVDASELPWRLLSRRYGAHLCFTPMIHSKNFLKDVKYRADNILACRQSTDRPLIAQFCGNDPETLKQCSILIGPYVDGVDLNLGCPQKIAKTGHYGAFLQDEWDLVGEIVRRIAETGIPVSGKIRRFPGDVGKTVEYAKMLETAGCWMLTVHGRTREQKGRETGAADWEYVKAVKAALKIPVLSNGNIDSLSDVHRCIAFTSVDGVMSAEGNLHNPAIFAGLNPLVWDMGSEYLKLVRQFPCPMSYVRGHLFKLYHHLTSLEVNHDLREKLGRANCLENFEEITALLKSRYESIIMTENPSKYAESLGLPMAPWFCQPYRRPPPVPVLTTKNSENSEKHKKFEEPQLEEDESGQPIKKVAKISKKQLKRMSKYYTTGKKSKAERKSKVDLCMNCVNPAGINCDWKCCRLCCSRKCEKELLECLKHKNKLEFILPKPPPSAHQPQAQQRNQPQ